MTEKAREKAKLNREWQQISAVRRLPGSLVPGQEQEPGHEAGFCFDRKPLTIAVKGVVVMHGDFTCIT